jgi:hypothetical protein
MKQIAIFFLFSLAFPNLYAHEVVRVIDTLPPGHATLDQVFAQFNSTQVTSGLLADRSLYKQAKE